MKLLQNLTVCSGAESLAPATQFHIPTSQSALGPPVFNTFDFEMCFAPQQKAAGAEPSGQMRNKKLHAAGARNTFPSQNAQNTSTQDNSWKSTCRKSTPVWCEAHFEVKMLKHLSFGTLLGIELSEKCTPLRREAHVQFNMYKTHQRRSTFGG